jgi:hypothetical protein
MACILVIGASASRRGLQGRRSGACNWRRIVALISWSSSGSCTHMPVCRALVAQATRQEGAGWSLLHTSRVRTSDDWRFTCRSGVPSGGGSDRVLLLCPKINGVVGTTMRGSSAAPATAVQCSGFGSGEVGASHSSSCRLRPLALCPSPLSPKASSAGPGMEGGMRWKGEGRESILRLCLELPREYATECDADKICFSGRLP